MNFNKTIVSGMCIAFLSACGGGGEDSPSDAATGRYSQTDVTNVAKTGVWMNSVAGTKLILAPLYAGGVLQAFSIDTGAGGTAPAPCRTGTGTTRVVKPSSHASLLTGDEVTLTYNQCDLNGVILNGTAKLTLKANIVASTSRDINTYFDAAFTSFTVTVQNTTSTLTGTASMRVSSAGSLNSYAYNVAVPAGQTLAVETPVSGSPLRVEYAAGTTFAGTESKTPDTVSRKLDSNLRLQHRGVTENYEIKTPTALSGTAASPNAGTVEAYSKDGNLATSTTISGINAQVSGDTDRNGSRDMSFTVFVASLLL